MIIDLEDISIAENGITLKIIVMTIINFYVVLLVYILVCCDNESLQGNVKILSKIYDSITKGKHIYFLYFGF